MVGFCALGNLGLVEKLPKPGDDWLVGNLLSSVEDRLRAPSLAPSGSFQGGSDVVEFGVGIDWKIFEHYLIIFNY